MNNINMTSLENFAKLLPWIALIVVSVALIVVLIRFGVRLRSWLHLLQRKLVFLELTPPAFTSRTPLATQKLISVIHAQRASRSHKEKLLGRDIVVAPEMPASYETGVRFIVQVEQRLAAGLQQAITAYLPDVKVQEVADFLPDKADKSWQVIDFKQTGHYAFPLAAHTSLEQHDPVAYLAGAMTKLAQDELMSFQLILTPVKLREAGLLSIMERPTRASTPRKRTPTINYKSLNDSGLPVRLVLLSLN